MLTKFNDEDSFLTSCYQEGHFFAINNIIIKKKNNLNLIKMKCVMINIVYF